MIEYNVHATERKISFAPRFISAVVDGGEYGTYLTIAGSQDEFAVDETYDKVLSDIKESELSSVLADKRSPLISKDFVSINGTEYRISYHKETFSGGLVDGYYVYLNSNMEITIDGEIKLALEEVRGVASTNTYGGRYTITLVVGLLFDPELVCKEIEQLLFEKF